MSSGVALAPMTFNEMLEKSVLFTMSQAWQLGRAVMRARAQHTDVIQTVTSQQNGMVLLSGKVRFKMNVISLLSALVYSWEGGHYFLGILLDYQPL